MVYTISTIKSSIWQPGVGLVGKVMPPFFISCHTRRRASPEAARCDIIEVWMLIGWALFEYENDWKTEETQLIWKADCFFSSSHVAVELSYTACACVCVCVSVIVLLWIWLKIITRIHFCAAYRFMWTVLSLNFHDNLQCCLPTKIINLFFQWWMLPDILYVFLCLYWCVCVCALHCVCVHLLQPLLHWDQFLTWTPYMTDMLSHTTHLHSWLYLL